MPTYLIFIQVHGQPGIHQAEVPIAATMGDLQDALVRLGIVLDAESVIHLDESEHHLKGERHEQISDLKHGARFHVSRCHRIKTTVHYLHRTAEHEFPPGARLHSVKHWAMHAFGMTAIDAAEHVLQVCGSKTRPTSDAPLHQITDGHGCSVCFDLVPDKRVEG